MPHNAETFSQAFLSTLKSILTDKGVLLLLVIAPIIYGFFYPYPYSEEAVRRVPVAIVDNDHTDLSAQLIRFCHASPRLEVALMTSEQEAQNALMHQEIGGYMLIPAGLKRNVVNQRPAAVGVAANSAYLMINKEVIYGFSEAVGTVSAGAQIKRLRAQGMTFDQAYAAQDPVPLIMKGQYNPTQGYGSYVVPGVAILILHQTLLIGAALLIGTWREKGIHLVKMSVWRGRIAALSCVSWMMTLYYFGWLFLWQDYGHGANMGAALLLALVFSPTVAALGCVFGLWFAQRERAMQLLLFSSLPLFFMSGYAWPAHLLPQPLQVLRWLVPSTPAIQASIRFNQIGTSLADGWYLLAVLLLQFGVYLALLRYFGTPRRQHPKDGADNTVS